MAQLDQDARKIGDCDKVEEVDQVNTERLKQILREHGWPKISVYGPQAARAAASRKSVLSFRQGELRKVS